MFWCFRENLTNLRRVTTGRQGNYKNHPDFSFLLQDLPGLNPILPTAKSLRDLLPIGFLALSFFRA